MSKTYMDLNINERINIKSWWDALSLSYFFKNGNLKEDVEMSSRKAMLGAIRLNSSWRSHSSAASIME